MADPQGRARLAADRIAELTGRPRHDVLVVLGSGWAPAAEAFGEPSSRCAMTDVPGFLAPSAEGHDGEIRSYDLDGVATLVLLGRTHLYEGHGLDPVVHGVRTAVAAGVRTVLLTNAAGSLRDDWDLGQPVLVADHLTMTATSPVHGAHFVDLTDAWSPRLRRLARDLDPTLPEGVYAWLRGPHYETAAEGRWLRRVGADLVGMSTVPEAIAAREAGVEVLGIATVTAAEGPAEGATEGAAEGPAEGAAVIDPSAVVAIAERTAARCGPLLADLCRGACS